jgi:hypothetical protein
MEIIYIYKMIVNLTYVFFIYIYIYIYIYVLDKKRKVFIKLNVLFKTLYAMINIGIIPVK